MKTTFVFKFLFLPSFFSNYRFTSTQREALNLQPLYVSIFMSIIMLFKNLVEIKIEIISRLRCIDKYDDECVFSTLCHTRKPLIFQTINFTRSYIPRYIIYKICTVRLSRNYIFYFK